MKIKQVITANPLPGLEHILDSKLSDDRHVTLF